MRYYSSSAVETALTGNITNSATTINVGSVAGFPIQFPYTLSIDADNINKELVEVTSAAGTSLTVTRAIDGTSGVIHSLGAKVSHDHSARDFRESRTHEAAVAVHGVAVAVVGTTDTQILTNKDLSSGTNAFPSSLATSTQLTAEATARTAADALKADISTTVTLAGAQTVTNKNMTADTNTFPNRICPVGSMQQFLGATAPSGWLLADGSQVSRTTYADLFTLIGTAYGAGNGTTTFTLPDLRGRVPVGFDTTQTEFDALNKKNAADTKAHTLTIAQMPSHDHGGATGGSTVPGSVGTSGVGGNAYPPKGAGSADSVVQPNSNHAHPIGAQGGGAAHNNLQPYIVVNYIVKV